MEKESTSGVRDVTRAMKNTLLNVFSPFFNAGNGYFALFSHKINVHLILL